MKRLATVLLPVALFWVCTTIGLLSMRLFNSAAYITERPIPQLECVSYNPFFHFESFNPRVPSEEQVKLRWVQDDLRLLSKYTSCLRIYTTSNGMEIVPEVANRYGMEVIAGSYFYEDERRTRMDVAGLIRIANDNDNVTKLIVGNDTVHYTQTEIRKVPVTNQEIAFWIDYVKARVKQPVSTAEGSSIWMDDRAISPLPAHVDFVAANILPYWLGSADVKDSQTELLKRYQLLKRKYPGREVLISELGWPTLGSPFGRAEANVTNAYSALTSFTAIARDQEMPYVYFEAFDQPWKITETQGRTEAHWGLFDIFRQNNFVSYHFDFDGFVIIYLEAGYLLTALLLFLLWSDWTFGIRKPAWFASAVMAHLLGYFVAYTVALLTSEYLYKAVYSSSFLVIAGLILLVSLTRTIRTAIQVLGHKPLRRTLTHLPKSNHEPMVSIHIPCRNEEPEHVIACVQSLLNQTYTRFEIIVIDNNSTDERYWRPVQAFCEKQGDRVTFLHVERLEGFKAGALAYALDHMHPETEVVGLVDADYVLDPCWLVECLPYFGPNVGAVQAPQDYEQDFSSLFNRCIYDEYTGSFELGWFSATKRTRLSNMAPCCC